MFRIKICGITTVSDARACVDAGADALGLNFCAASPRHIDLERAVAICESLPDEITRVGVFVDATVERMLAVAEQLGLDWVQLHGSETPETLAQLAPRRVLRAFRVREAQFAPLLRYLQRCDQLGATPAAVLVDAFVPGVQGGTGMTVDWTSVSELVCQIAPLPLVLAGGLRPENIAHAIRAARPAAVDTASGVEAAPGRKDVALVKAFVENARRAFERGADADGPQI